MADKEGLSTTPGQVYIEVEYDYEYKAKDKMVTIRQGECYLLVKKTNEDWWQVRKEECTKAFYVPAQYVREVRHALMPPQKPALKAKPTVLDICQASNENFSRPHLEMSSFGHPSPSSTPSPSSERVTPPALCKDTNQNMGSPHHCKLLAELVLLHNNNNHHHSSDSTFTHTRADSPQLNMGDNHKSLEVNKICPPSALQAEMLNKLRNDSESGDEMSSSSTEHMQTTSPMGLGHSDSPVYTNLQELKISQSSLPPVPSGSPLHILGDWETHKDLSGRHFYYNRASGERTWKPPRSRDTISTSTVRGESQATTDSEECSSLNKWSSPDSDSCSSSPKHPFTPSEKCGVLNVTKITENGKRVRKNWASSWTVLQGFSLLFAKGQGGSTSWSHCHSGGSLSMLLLTLLSTWRRSLKPLPAVTCRPVHAAKFGSNQSKPEFTVDLRGGSVEWASKDKSSKKHVIELKTRQGTELLIQSEIDSVINDWYRTLTETINTHALEWDEAIEEDLPESPGGEKQDKEKELKEKESRRSRGMSCCLTEVYLHSSLVCVSVVMKASVSMDSSDQKKTRMKLRKFLTRRPTYQAVRDKGYIKDQVFGCSLSNLCQRENSSVPSFVKMCIEHVEDSGLSIDGLYRVSGNLAVIQKLRFAVNHDETVELTDNKWEDIHVTTGALKMFFRELPEPLFTYGSFTDFINAIKCSDYKQRVTSIKELIKKLPKANHDTMQVLFKHLRRVIDHSESNRMTTQSVAIVFGPTLLRPETETGNMAVYMVYQNQIVELILLEYDSVFGR
ncbi:rho GTPase-activating protein 12b isoform X11 [Gouania willdenowi]|uniref:rho GTPase-activating protein 12b isoform X11 n=1 Tax=Gouania willdenowi TaxID=441366 RepID=UPI001056D450|nr:rho GTPase-activating protein 12 isoform X11 [Gouania willdenowi]